MEGFWGLGRGLSSNLVDLPNTMLFLALNTRSFPHFHAVGDPSTSQAWRVNIAPGTVLATEPDRARQLYETEQERYERGSWHRS